MFKPNQIKVLVGFCNDMAKGLMLGAIVGQWSVPEVEWPIRVIISISWYLLALLSLAFALFLQRYDQR